MTNGGDGGGLGALEPAMVWGFFSRIAAVPRPSKKEERIRREVRAIAEEQGLTVREEPVGNLVIDVPASAGCEGAPVTVLQAHLDMVCEQNADSTHDFDREGIRLIVDHDAASGEQIVRADGTTLGADNGIGLAMALAAASASDVTHGPLEFLFTVDEESGMTGAGALTPDSLRGRRLLNLDSEEDDILCMGCAGGCDVSLTFECELEDPHDGAVACRVAVSGLRGGHSGDDIHKHRGNANRLLARTLLRADSGSVRLVSIRGGRLRNVIPREAEAVVSGSPALLDALRTAARVVTEEAAEELTEKGLVISVEPVSGVDGSAVLSASHTRRILTTIVALPHGVMGMDQAITGLVETSNNIATVEGSLVDGRHAMRIEIGALARSSSAACKKAVVDQIAAVGRLAGAAVEIGNDYAGWQPNIESPTLATCSRVYKELFGEEPNVTAIHAGLECGVIGDRVGGMDMVSFGPRIVGAHSPDERVYVASVQKSWRYLLAVLADLARGE